MVPSTIVSVFLPDAVVLERRAAGRQPSELQQ